MKYNLKKVGIFDQKIIEVAIVECIICTIYESLIICPYIFIILIIDKTMLMQFSDYPAAIFMLGSSEKVQESRMPNKSRN